MKFYKILYLPFYLSLFESKHWGLSSKSFPILVFLSTTIKQNTSLSLEYTSPESEFKEFKEAAA